MKTPTYKDYLEGTARVLAESQEKGTHYVGFRGKSLIVRPNVFSPKYFHDSHFFANKIPITPGQSFFEVGPGTGIASISAALNGAKRVFAIDSNSDAVKNTQENARRYGVQDKIEVHHGNLFTIYDEGEITEKFDSIFWNVPFGFIRESKQLTPLEEAVIDPFYGKITKFVETAPDHLNPEGHLYIGFSNTLGFPLLLKTILSENGFDYDIIAKTKSKEVHPVTFELYEAKLN